MSEPIHILSLGAGVQSSTLALMAAAGEVTPMPKAAIFADTQAEPKAVYGWLDWLEKRLPFPVIRASKGNLAGTTLKMHTSRTGSKWVKSSIPAYALESGVSRGILRRSCTMDFKIDVINREMRKLVGRKRDARVICWIGISTDEADRMKPNPKAWITNVWPLIERRISRGGCLAWLKSNGFPAPPKSACYFCPYHNDAMWLDMKQNRPLELAKATRYEAALQRTMSRVSGFRGQVFLHADRVPLAQVDFAKPREATPEFNFFRNACEGLCGV